MQIKRVGTESAPQGQMSHPSLWKHCHPPVRSDSPDTHPPQNPSGQMHRKIGEIAKEAWEFSVSDSSSGGAKKAISFIFFGSHLCGIFEFKNHHLCLIASRPQRQRSVGCTTTPTGRFWAAPEKPPYSSLVRSPRDPCFASPLNLHFLLRFSVRRTQPLETSVRFTTLLYCTRASISKAIRAEIKQKPLDF